MSIHDFNARIVYIKSHFSYITYDGGGSDEDGFVKIEEDEVCDRRRGEDEITERERERDMKK